MNDVMVNAGIARQPLVQLVREALARDGSRPVSMMETHISWVLLTGEYAYKIKKPVDLGFLDFTTLAARKHFCDEELRLNRRLAPDLYLDVVAIGGSVDAPTIGGAGPALEYAVRMREFPQDALLSRVLARGALTGAHVDALAAQVAAFHGRIETAGEGAPYGVPADILHYAVQNFVQIRRLVTLPSDVHALSALEAWTRRTYATLRPALAARRHDGFVRECHGDLHLGNMALVGDRLTIFDALEFNPELRWIDTMSEAAFVAMDLADRGRRDFANRFLNAYVEATGDYTGLAVLRFYLVYRAMVRAKVACLRTAQLGAGKPGDDLLAEFRGYVNLARCYAAPAMGAVVLTHGVAGSGKTTLAQALIERLGAIRVRSDVERKRLHGLAPEERSGSAVGAGLYGGDATERTYARVAGLVRRVAEADHVAIADATFLQRAQRDRFRELAVGMGVPFVILDCTASAEILRTRVAARGQRGTDPSEADIAVLEHQLRTGEALAADERRFAMSYDAGTAAGPAPDAAWWHTLAGRLSGTDDSRKAMPLPLYGDAGTNIKPDRRA